VKGAPDFERETDDVSHADTSGFGYVAIAGKRPHLLLHSVSGFRSAAGEHYKVLGDDNVWSYAPLGYGSGIGEGIFSWSKDRLLEWRGPQPEVARQEAPGATRLPKLRVVQGADKVAPSLPKALEKRLTSEGFSLATYTVLRTGEVLAIGYLGRSREGAFGTVLWTDNVKEPAYIASSAEGLTDPEEMRLLGGTSLANVRLQVLDKVMRLEGSSWVEESTVPKDGLPDVWFGSTLVMEKDSVYFARTAKDAPWLPIATTDAKPDRISHAVDAEGTLWMTEDDLLLSSRKPKEERDVTEEDLVMGRKASILRGGSFDVTGERPGPFAPRNCRMHYVLLDQSAAASATQDFSKIGAALRGHTELAKAKFIVSRERAFQFFGAQIQDEATANKLAALTQKAIKRGTVLCAEPVAVREVKIDLASGAVSP
jgi:hypothetical protein